MNELVKKDQSVTIVPKDFNFTNKGAVTEVSDKGFRMKMKYPTTGIKERYICEFYSQTPNGILFFNPMKHRFLQRRQFTLVKFITETIMTDKIGNEYEISTVDLSAGGLKFQTKTSIDLDMEYKIQINLNEEQTVYCWLQPIRMEKQDTGKFLLSGRFINQVNVDKMTLIQYCMNKNMEAKNQ